MRRAVKLTALAVGLTAIAWGFFERHSLAQFKAEAREATVLYTTAPDQRTSRAGATSHSADFVFVTDAGKQVSGRRVYREEIARDLQAGRPVTVRYDPRDPAGFVLEKSQAPWGAMSFGAIVILIALFL